VLTAHRTCPIEMPSPWTCPVDAISIAVSRAEAAASSLSLRRKPQVRADTECTALVCNQPLAVTAEQMGITPFQ
jgi:hypothetical protein